MLDIFLTALALFLVCEGVLPFLVPAQWRRTLLHVASCEDRQLRSLGFVLLMMGTVLMLCVHMGIL